MSLDFFPYVFSSQYISHATKWRPTIKYILTASEWEAVKEFFFLFRLCILAMRLSSSLSRKSTRIHPAIKKKQ